MAQASRVGDSSGVTTDTAVRNGHARLHGHRGIDEASRRPRPGGVPERARPSTRRLVRGAFGRHGGYEVDTAGDGFFYAFSTAADAVRAVVEALAALEGGPIRIRAGIHTGEPILDPPKYVGLDVHRAARIMAAAHGGQALLSPNDPRPARRRASPSATSASTASRISPHPSASSSSGRASSRGRGPCTRRTFPSRQPSSSAARVSWEDLAERLRNGVRLLTLTGPGGTGKTRLALQAAAEAADDFDDGVWWVPLAALRDPALVLRHTAKTLDVIEQPDRPLEDVLAEMLGGKRMLLLLDNAEHLLPGAADVDRDAPRPRRAEARRDEPRAAPARRRARLPGSATYGARGPRSLRRPRRRIDPAFEATEADRRALQPARQSAARARARRRPHRRPPARADPRAPRAAASTCSRAAATPTRASRRCAPPSPGRTTSSTTTSASSSRRFAVFAGGATLEAVEERLRRRPRNARLARRQEPRPPRRRPLLDARDDPRVRARPARRGGDRSGDRAARRVLRAVRGRRGRGLAAGTTPRPGFPASSRSCRISAPRCRAALERGLAPDGTCLIATPAAGTGRRGAARPRDAAGSIRPVLQPPSPTPTAQAPASGRHGSRSSRATWTRPASSTSKLQRPRKLRATFFIEAGSLAYIAWVSRERGDSTAGQRAVRAEPCASRRLVRSLGAVGGPAPAVRLGGRRGRRVALRHRGGPGAQARGRRRDRDLRQL